MRLALGTAQFGLAYGVANRGGQIEPNIAAAIISRAWAVGMDTIDTAIGYGQSEQRLGEIGVDSWRIVSKLPEYPRDCPNIIEWVNSSVEGSLARLGVGRLHGLLLHRPQQLLEHGGHELYRAMVRIKASGKVGKIGISIYSPDELDMIWPHFQFDLVQSPFNVFDRRLATTGWLQKLNREGVEVHVRSVFLQGLLLAGNDGIPVGFQRWSSLWAAWHSWLRDVSCSPIQAALGHVLAFPEISRVIVGVDSLEQLDEILRGASVRQGVAPQVLMSEDLDLINPTRWSAFL